LIKGTILDFDSLASTDLCLDRLDSSVDAWRKYPVTLPSQTLDRLKDTDVVLTNKVVLDRPVLESSPHLKLIVIMATGTNNVDLDAAHSLGIPVCNVRGYSTQSVVQHTFAMILALRNRLFEYDSLVKGGAWQESDFFGLLDCPIEELNRSVLGVVGFGAIGQAVASVGRAFGMKVIVAESLIGNQSGDRLPLEKVLQLADVLTVHCPLTPSSKGLIGADQLALMKKNAILVNVARGGVVDEEALACALRERRIFAAGVDVLSEEPPRNGSPLMDEGIPNLLLTPHIAWGSRQARQCLVNEMARIIESYRAGELVNCVNGL